MAKAKSIQRPQAYLVRNQFRFADPTGFLPEQWRTIAREPVNSMAQSFIVRELSSLDYTIVSDEREDSRVEDYSKRWDETFEEGDGFDVWLNRVIRDACTLPFGAASEVGYAGEDLDWVLHVDAGTMMPTYEKSKPYCQVNPDNWADKVFFSKEQLKRLRVAPRPDIRFKEYQIAPTEDAYLAIEALSRVYLYYVKQLEDTPPPGILDVVDMDYDEVIAWAKEFRELITGTDPIKIPILYGHQKAATWIPFGRSPNDLNLLEQFKRFAEIILGKYGLSIGDLRLFEHEATKAGERVSQLVTERSGIGYWASMIEGYLGRMLPDGLRFKFKQPRPERELVVNQRRQIQLAILQAAVGNKPLMTLDQAAEQAEDWELFTVPIEPPEPEPVPAALMPGQNGQQVPTQEELEQTEEVRDQMTDTDLAKKAALIVKEDLGEWRDPPPTAVDRLVGFIKDRFKESGDKAEEPKIGELLEEARRLLIESPEEAPPEKKALSGEELDAAIDALLEKADWYDIGLNDIPQLEAVLSEMYAHGLNKAAGEIEMLRFGLSDVPSMSIDWNLRDPRVKELITKHAAEMVQNVNNGTKYYLREMLKEAVDQGYGTVEATEMIQKDVFGLPSGEASKFTKNRIMSIVNFEINKAMSTAAHNLRQEVGLTQKQWFTNRVSPCEICLWNEAQGPVPMDFEYRTVFGVAQTPPAHPQTCRCLTTAVKADVDRVFGADEEVEWPFTLREAAEALVE